MGRLITVTPTNRPEVLAAIRTDFGRRNPTLPDWLPAPPRLHVLAEAIGTADFVSTPHQFWAYTSSTGEIGGVLAFIAPSLVLMAGHGEGATHMGLALRSLKWAIILGDEPLTTDALTTWRRLHWWGREPRSRPQVFMYTFGPALQPAGSDPAYGVAIAEDAHRLTDLAATLHVDDEFGPPLSERALDQVFVRMEQSIARHVCWVLREGSQVLAKLEITNHSSHYGAQLSGVVVHPQARGRGLGTRLVRAACADLFHVGIPMVTLHTRAVNYPAIRAYEKAGFTLGDTQSLVLA